MSAHSPSAGSLTLASPRLLRLSLHVLVIALLTLASVRAVVDGAGNAPAVIVVAVVLGAGFLAGEWVSRVRRTRASAMAWLVGCIVGWLVLLGLTADAVWLAFPLFLVELHLLPARWGVPAVAVTTAAAVAGFAAHNGAVVPSAVIGPVIGAAVAVGTVRGYQALYRESEQRRLLIEQLTAARADLAAAERSAGVLAERERLAREIHDTIAQGLSSIQLLLRAAERALPVDPSAAAEYVEQARAAAQENLAEARRFVRGLAPPDLAQGPLSAALERLCNTTTQRSGVAVRFHVDGVVQTVPTGHEAALLRIAQSALANVVAHASATRADVTLSFLDTRVALDVVDDGVGFDASMLPAPDGDSGFGLVAMRSRVAALGGTLDIESAPGQSTAIAVSFSLSAGEPS